MKLNELKPNKTLKGKSKRVGRGLGSGKGTYSARGVKGQRSRSGSKKKPGFEGGRTPLISQIPKKRGFKSLVSKPETVNISDLEKKFKEGDNIDKKILHEKGLINSQNAKVKVLGDGEINKKLKVEVDLYSKSAGEKIEKVGGEAKIIENKKFAKKSKKTENKKS